MEEIGGLGRVGARVGKVAAEEFGGGEIDEDQHTLAAWVETDVAGRGGQVRGGQAVSE